MKYKKGTFVVVPNIDRLDVVPALAQALYLWLCRYSNEDGECFPSRKKLAGHLGCDMRTVDKHITFLQDTGFISKTTRKKKGTEQNMSNLYQIHLFPHPSEVNDTTPSEPDVPVTISTKNYTNLTKEVVTDNTSPPKEEVPYSFIVEFSKMGDSLWLPDKIIYNYWRKKGFTFDNLKQFKAARSRNIRPAQALEGYTSKQINETMDYCEEKYKEVGWTLETCGKKIADIVNRK